MVKKFLPEHPSFDLAVNVMTFQPGTPLPFVETHIMEHGLLMLSGGGVYKVEEVWYPVKEGDVIWMGPLLFAVVWSVGQGACELSALQRGEPRSV